MAVPAPTLLASPKFAEVFPTVATALLSEAHATLSVISWLEESLKIPVAIKVFCAPIGRVAAAGASDTETIVALLTLNGTEAVLLPRVAVTLIRPGAMPVPIPLLDPIERMVGSEEDQVT